MSAFQYVHGEIGEILDEEGLTMNKFMTEFIPGRFADTIRDTHEEISRPDLRLSAYLRAIVDEAKKCSPSELKNKLALCYSKKIVPGTATACLAIRISKWQSFRGYSMDDLKKVTTQ